jgi:hypothetical protein
MMNRAIVGLVIVNADEAAVALWGFLHGMVGLGYTGL